MISSGIAISVARSIGSFRRRWRSCDLRRGCASSEHYDASRASGCEVPSVSRPGGPCHERCPRARGAPVAHAGAPRRSRARVRREPRGHGARSTSAGASFFPPILDDIAARHVLGPRQPVRLPARRDRRGFATALLAKAAEGVPSGSSSTGRARARPVGPRVLRAAAGRRRRRRVVRATRSCALAAAAAAGREALGLDQLGHFDHRKFVVVDGRVGWVGGAGIEDHFDDGRFHDLFLRLTGPVVSQLQLVFLATLPLARRRRPRRSSSTRSSPPTSRAGAVPATVLHNAPGQLPADHDRDRASCSTARARRSTSSTPTSPTAG